MPRWLLVSAGLAVILAFVLLGNTAAKTGQAGQLPRPAPASSSRPAGPAGGGGLPVGPPHTGAPGHGYATVAGTISKRLRFTAVTCIRSPNAPDGLLARGSTSLAAGVPNTLGVSTDTSTLRRIELKLTSGQAWSDEQIRTPPTVRRTGKTLTFSGRLTPESGTHGGLVTVTGVLTCTSIITLG
jgi:hypothetical protein